MKKIDASIIILTHNSGTSFKKVLAGVFSQRNVSFETIIIDSCSTDDTLKMAANYPLKIVRIKESKFGHGRTRNLGAKLAKGKYVIFLTHDAIPADKNWLREILSRFCDRDVAAVYGRQIPKHNEGTLDKLFFLNLYGRKSIEWTIGSYTCGDNIFSDANSAVRKDLLLSYPYKNIIVSEDYEWANRMIHRGYKIVYEPKAKVIHSHSYNLYSLFKRNFDIGVSYKSIHSFNSNTNFIKKGAKLFVNEAKYLVDSGKVHLLPEAIIRDSIRFFAVNLGKSESIFPRIIKKNYLSAQRGYWI